MVLIITRYLYTGKINITNNTGIELLDIMVVSDEFNLLRLTKLIEDFIIENHRQFLQNDPVGIFQIVYYRQTFNNIKKFCLETICSEPKILFNSDKFINLSAPLLEVILKRDDLNFVEIEIWENLVKWGLSQNPTFNQDISKWNQEDFQTFKSILYKFIPLIRFYEISSIDYVNKVRPYEEILSKELRDDILKFHMIPGYKPTFNTHTPRYSICYDIDSVIINLKHITIFANWIDKKKGNSKYIKEIPYKFNLIYRASRDGMTPAAFHEKCDNQGPTIVVVKVKGSEQIVGGYNPLAWDSSNLWKSTKNSFIFSFINRTNLQTAKVGYSNGDQYSIGRYSEYGPIFGIGHDLIFCPPNCTINDLRSYPNVDIPRKFNVDDYEVFRVIGPTLDQPTKKIIKIKNFFFGVK